MGEGKKEEKKEEKAEEKTEATKPAEEEKKVEEKPAEEKKDEEKAAEEEKKEEEVSAEPPIAELTDEEKKLWFRPKSPTDLSDDVLNTAFGDFSVPEKSEGFDEVIFDWQAEAGAKKYLKTWVLDRKRISRVENLKPSQWFNDKLKEWQTQFAEFQAKLEKPADD